MYHFSYQPNDYIACHKLFQQEQRKNIYKILKLVYLFALVTIVPLIAIGSLFSSGMFLSTLITDLFNVGKCLVPIFLIPTAIFFIQFDQPVFYKIGIRYQFRKYPELYGQKFTVSFNDDGVLFEGDNSEQFVKWEGYDGVIESRDYFQLVYGEDLYRIIPKRAFPAETDLQVFRTQLQKKFEGYRFYE